jgi:hypothetical protein
LTLQGTDTIPDLDLRRIYYEGTSMGGVLGSAFLGLTPKLSGAFMHVPGVGITNILSHSAIWSLFKRLVPREATGGELAAYFGMVQQEVDYADGINFIHHAREGTTALPYPYTPFPVAAVYAHSDGIVFNNASVALSEILDLPLAPTNSDAVADVYAALPMRHTETNLWFDEQGYGVRMIKPMTAVPANWFANSEFFTNLATNGNELMAHLSFISSGGREYQEAWTRRVILGEPTAQLIDHTIPENHHEY